jgi:hypothetical protein
VKTALLLLLFAACSAPATAPAVSAAAPPRADVPMSDPYEYGIDRISKDAGEAIFATTGIGDPYRTGVPYPIFLALQKAYPQTFGDLAKRYGFIDAGGELPVGMHLTTDPITGVQFVVTSCSLCHAEKVGDRVVVGLGNKRVRIHAYDAAFVKVAPKISVEKLGRLADEAAKAKGLKWPDQYKEAIVGGFVTALKQRSVERAELIARVENGPPGRVATIESFVPVLAKLSGKDVGYAKDIGWAKVPDVIGFGVRTTLSWDGSGEGPMDLLAVEADVAAGVRVEWLEKHPFQGASLGAYLRQPAERPKFPGRIDTELARKGKKLFEDNCTQCHGRYDGNGRVLEYEEKVVSLTDLGTDPARAMAATADFERAANDPALTRGYTRFKRQFGYVPPVLTNVWARAPYGHAGQWPSLAVMATEPDKREKQFVVRLDEPYDLGTVGVATRATGAVGAGEYLHDGTKPGFSVLGHPFLADLGGDAAAVIEYLKTL